jgi:hypothetical protein
MASEFFRGSDLLFLRAPVRLEVNSSQTVTPQAGIPPKSHTSAVTKGAIGGVAGGVAALLAVGTIALVAWHRRKQSHGRTSVGSSFLRESTNQGTHATVTPFNPTMSTPIEAAPFVAGTQMDFPQRLSSRPFSTGDPPLPLRRMVSVPTGLSGKELARLRSNRLRSQAMDGRASDPLLTVTIGRDALGGAVASPTSSSEFRRPRSENNFSRQEMHEIQQLLAERPESPPPSYVSRPQGSNMF